MASRVQVLFFAFLLGWIARGGVAVSQEVQEVAANSLHEFTSKNGQKVVAAITGLSEDRRKMKIRREDGQEFETEIVLLSLDDQQFIKDWIKTAPETGALVSGGVSMPADYRVETTISRVLGDSRDHRDGSYRIEERDHFYRIVAKNLSRTTLDGAKLEYALVWRDEVVVYRSDDGETRYTTDRDNSGNSPLVKRLGTAPLESLRYNAEDTVSTEPASIDRVLYSGNDVFYEDELVGVKIRLLSADGSVLHESHSGAAAAASMTWEEIADLPDPKVID